MLSVFGPTSCRLLRYFLMAAEAWDWKIEGMEHQRSYARIGTVVRTYDLSLELTVVGFVVEMMLLDYHSEQLYGQYRIQLRKRLLDLADLENSERDNLPIVPKVSHEQSIPAVVLGCNHWAVNSGVEEVLVVVEVWALPQRRW